MKGMPSFEDRLRNPSLSVIDFEFITLHPEAKLAIWQRYCQDVLFKMRIDEYIKKDLVFAFRFKEAFKSYFQKGKGR